MIHVDVSTEFDTINGASLLLLLFGEPRDLVRNNNNGEKYTYILDDDGNWQEIPF